jgi:hypothetical protein
LDFFLATFLVVFFVSTFFFDFLTLSRVSFEKSNTYLFSSAI